METAQVTILISVIAILVSAATGALTLFRTAKRDSFNELDAICKQQWTAIDLLKRSREELATEIKVLRANSERDVANVRADIGHTAVKVLENTATARNAASDAVAAKNLAFSMAEKAKALAHDVAETAKSLAADVAERAEIRLSDIEETGKATHKIVNNQRTVMLRQVAVLSRLYANDHPDNEAAQTAAEQAMADAAMANEAQTP